VAESSGFRRLAYRGLLVLAGLAVVMQVIPVSRTNPPVETEIQAPAQVQAILRRSCYNCHSNETVWPWYSHVAPVSWLVASDVHEARSHMNFSTWNQYTEAKRASRIGDIWDEVSKGDMPPADYLLLHRDAVLTAADLQILRAWSNGQLASRKP
jgi:Haem-binding domain